MKVRQIIYIKSITETVNFTSLSTSHAIHNTTKHDTYDRDHDVMDEVRWISAYDASFAVAQELKIALP